jgi:hypothetical protein
VVLCRVASWVTGRRLVSLPFADHCDPLVTDSRDFDQILAALREERARGWGSVELRPRASKLPGDAGFEPTASFLLHVIDIRSPLDVLFGRTHRNMIQRKVRRARREGIDIAVGRTPELMHQFYRLMIQTRRRHGLPPQPIEWFQNLGTCFGDRLTMRIASLDGKPIAGILTLRHQNSLVYKYGGSDAAHHPLGAVPALFWDTIRDAKTQGLETLDLGRSDMHSAGLIAFKNNLGGTGVSMTYWKYSVRATRRIPKAAASIARGLLARMPEALLTNVGRVVYRHLG